MASVSIVASAISVQARGASLFRIMKRRLLPPRALTGSRIPVIVKGIGAQVISNQQATTIHDALNSFQIELPSWGFANTGTRFGKFIQPAAATTTEEKFSDAGQVHRWTGVCPTIALHVLWDLPNGIADVPAVQQLAVTHGLRAGSINPNTFQDQVYKYGSLANPDAQVRREALDHILSSIEIAGRLGSRDLSLWFADGSNYPGTQNIRRRRQWMQEGLKTAYASLAAQQRMLVEYKPFEPAFYHTDIADWGMALEYARSAGPNAKVLVDTGHHYQGQNIEQIVAWLLDLNMLGGFHFNDRRYADDDLTMGSIDPYQVFRIFHEIRLFEWETGKRADIAYMIDQPQGQDRGHDPDRERCDGIVRQGGTGRSRKAGRPAIQVRAGGCGDLFEGCVFDGRAAGDPRVGAIERFAGGSDGCFPAKRVPGADHWRAGTEERRGRLQLRVKAAGAGCPTFPETATL